MKLIAVTPILRMFDEGLARGFFVDWLQFSVLFEHRFGDDMPLYLGLIRDGVELHLSEHHGDTTPGTRVRIEVDDIHAFQAEVTSRPYARLRPGPPIRQDWSWMATDQFGNRLTFY